MPRIHGLDGPYHVFFYSFDCSEPQHVHVRRDKKLCKFWLDPLMLAVNRGFTPQELTSIRHFVRENLSQIQRAWDEHCNPE